MARKTKQNWYDIAYQGLIESGVEAISAEVLFYSFIGLQNRQPMPSEKEFQQFQRLINEILEEVLTS